MRKPFFRKARNAWYYVTTGGKFVKLAEDEETAFELWNSIRETRRTSGHPHLTVGTLSSRFLTEQELLIKSARYKLIEHYVSAFSAEYDRTLCRDVDKTLVAKWLNCQTTWGDWARHDAIACLKRLFRWGVEEGQIARNPLARMPNPKPQSRQRIMTDEEHRALVEAAREQKVSGPQFAHVLIASRCGVRPQHIRDVTAGHIVGDTWVFQNHKTRGKTGKPLIVYLPPCLVTLTRILVDLHPTGHLFQQETGIAWTKDRIAGRLRRLRRKIGLPDDVVIYCYRHTFATNSLLAGLSVSEVAELLGHSDARMVSEVYGHLDQHNEHLRQAAARSYRRDRSDA